MQQIGMWKIEQKVPVRLAGSSVRLEEHLEDWIKNDPSLLKSGLTIVGRQIHLGEPGILDLLAIDQQRIWLSAAFGQGAKPIWRRISSRDSAESHKHSSTKVSGAG